MRVKIDNNISTNLIGHYDNYRKQNKGYILYRYDTKTEHYIFYVGNKKLYNYVLITFILIFKYKYKTYY